MTPDQAPQRPRPSSTLRSGSATEDVRRGAPLAVVPSLDHSPGTGGTRRIITWVCAMFFAAIPACDPGADTTKSKEQTSRVCKVEGYFQMGEARLDFVDGFVSLDSEPLEGHRYGFTCHLSHDSFSPGELASILQGACADMNHQSVPKGFPGPRAMGEGKRLSPRVTISIGGWPTATLPNVEQARLSMHHWYFPTEYGDMSVGIGRETFQVLEINTKEPVTIKFHTKGQEDIGGQTMRWDIKFEGVMYADIWPMRERWKGR